MSGESYFAEGASHSSDVCTSYQIKSMEHTETLNSFLSYSSMSSSRLCCFFFRTVANALDTMFQKGDRIAIDMPMTCNAVIVYLAIILGGFVVVSIADSFAPQEIGTRMRVSEAKAIFTQVRPYQALHPSVL